MDVYLLLRNLLHLHLLHGHLLLLNWNLLLLNWNVLYRYVLHLRNLLLLLEIGVINEQLR